MFKDKKIVWLMLFGLIIRIAFTIWGAPVYYGTTNFATNYGDSWAWITGIYNLIHHHVFSADITYPGGKFYRPPGYSLFLGIFYLLSGCNMDLFIKVTMWSQVVLDSITIWFVYETIKNIGGSTKFARLATVLYTLYPFVIVWGPVLYAEAPTTFFLFVALYYLTKKEGKNNLIKSGVLFGFTVLMRLQCFFLIPAIVYYLIKKNKGFSSLFKKPVLGFLIAFGIVYGTWPVRNLMYGEFVPAERLANPKHFSKDLYSYMLYIWSVKTDHLPQFDQIIHGQPVEWPKASYLELGDSALLAELAVKCNTCGRGFSYFKESAGLIKKPIVEETPCTIEIGEAFDKLRREQMEHNSFHYYVTVPLSNFKKAIFKSQLYGNKSTAVIIVSTMLFGFRTLMIFLGLLGIWMNRKSAYIDRLFSSVILIYFVLLYFVLCFIYRDIEIRYFLHADILLLIPATIPIYIVLRKWMPDTFSENKQDS